MKAFRLLDPVVAERSERLYPKQFFQTRDGLYVCSSFRSLIVMGATQTAQETKVNARCAELVRASFDRRIDREMELVGRDLFDENQVCLFLAGRIELQPFGSSGRLATCGSKNLLFTTQHVVWWWSSRIRGTWVVDAARRGYGQWDEGDHLFLRAD